MSLALEKKVIRKLYYKIKILCADKYRYLSEKGIYGIDGVHFSEENSTSIFNILMFSILEDDNLLIHIPQDTVTDSNLNISRNIGNSYNSSSCNLKKSSRISIPNEIFKLVGFLKLCMETVLF
jgi:hypothetical protein